jgi:hypothetical protein
MSRSLTPSAYSPGGERGPGERKEGEGQEGHKEQTEGPPHQDPAWGQLPMIPVQASDTQGTNRLPAVAFGL